MPLMYPTPLLPGTILSVVLVVVLVQNFSCNGISADLMTETASCSFLFSSDIPFTYSSLSNNWTLFEACISEIWPLLDKNSEIVKSSDSLSPSVGEF